jgi:hypothetical protein
LRAAEFKNNGCDIGKAPKIQNTAIVAVIERYKGVNLI